MAWNRLSKENKSEISENIKKKKCECSMNIHACINEPRVMSIQGFFFSGHHRLQCKLLISENNSDSMLPNKFSTTHPLINLFDIGMMPNGPLVA